MPKVSTNISLDSELKKDSQILFSELGLDLTTAITLFLKQALREQGLPFAVSKNIHNVETVAALKEYEAMKAHPENYKRYSSSSEAIKDVL